MRRSITALLVALLALGGLIVPAHAGSISGTLSGDSTLTSTTSPGIFVQNFTGDGEDTTFGSFTPQSRSTIDFSHPPNILISNGMFLEIFYQGTLYGTTSGNGTASGQGTATVTIAFLFTGGTGIFARASGDATFTGTITSTSATTESITGSYVGTLQGVPEPSTLALFAPAVGIGVGILIRERRRTVTAR